MPPRRRSRARTGLLACLAWCGATAASATDGVLEINQTCATSTGCFAGDSPGFPVTLTATAPARSVRLTGDLTTLVANQTLINVSASGATVDLGGFRLVGPASCSGVPVSACTNTGIGVGVLGTSDVSVRNGTITGMGDDGVRLDFSGRVEGLHVFQNGGDGISVGNESIVWRNISTSNGDDGIDCADRCAVHDNTSTGNRNDGARLGPRAAFAGNVFSQNGLADVAGGHASGGNQCADRSCSARGTRRFYMTQALFNGAQALGGCAAGFHMASMWELLDVSGLEYDVVRGQTSADSGQGPPTNPFALAFAWIRTGESSQSSGTLPGIDNCSAWTSTAGNGTQASLGTIGSWNAAPSTRVEPWNVGAVACNLPARVWCAED